MPQSDPRQHPTAGAVLRKGRYCFTVGSLTGTRVHYSLYESELPRGKEKPLLACDCSLKRWREMMQGAEVRG